MIEKPDWTPERSLLSMRDIGRLVLTEVRLFFERFDDDNCDLMNGEKDA